MSRSKQSTVDRDYGMLYAGISRSLTDASEHENCRQLLRSEGHVALVYKAITPECAATSSQKRHLNIRGETEEGDKIGTALVP
jgi:hypothetical protein